MEILIVEDEQEIAAIIQECLEAEGFSCHVCHDGHSALRLFAERQPDLIILDLSYRVHISLLCFVSEIFAP